MTSPLSFKGQMGPLYYALFSAAVFFSQHLVVFIAFKVQGIPLGLNWLFFLVPLRSLLTCQPLLLGSGCAAQLSDLLLILTFAYVLIVGWVLAALAFRRAADANISEWIAAVAMAPIVQLPVIAYLSVTPSRAKGNGSPVASVDASRFGWAPAVHGVAAGLGLTLFAVTIGALFFGSYGYGIFVVSPFLVGAITAYFANRIEDFGESRTAQLVVGATAIGGLGLVGTALEGIICIILVAPLGIGVAFIGGLLGRAIARSTRRPANQALSGFALLPMVFALETVMPATATFDTYQTIGVNAPPNVVWKSIIKMDTMDEPVALPFRLGVAYPLRGEVLGEGVDAVRHGEFSTGIAIERVTEWVPNRKLAFVVVNDVPAMRELSPYQHVHAPHAVGYFRTSTTSFELLPRADGGTDIVERTSHQLKIDPAFYWLPMARWIVHENNARVLAHIQRQAERSLR